MFSVPFLALCLSLSPVAPVDGYYHAAGTLPDGTDYESLCTIRRKDHLYLVTWHVDPPIVGVGLLDGDRLTVGWATTVKDGDREVLVRGVSVFRCRPAELQGSWTTWPGDGTGHETLKLLKPLGPKKERL